MTPYQDRRPVVLATDWLTDNVGREPLRPAAEPALREWIVSNRANETGVTDDDPNAGGEGSGLRIRPRGVRNDRRANAGPNLCCEMGNMPLQTIVH